MKRTLHHCIGVENFRHSSFKLERMQIYIGQGQPYKNIFGMLLQYLGTHFPFTHF